MCTGEWADSQETTGVQDLREHLWDQASGMQTRDVGVGQDLTCKTDLRNPSEYTPKAGLNDREVVSSSIQCPMLPDGSAYRAPHPTSSPARSSPAPGSCRPLSLFHASSLQTPMAGGFPQCRWEGGTGPGQRYLGGIDGLLVGAVAKQGHPELRGDAAKRGDLVGAGAAGV